MPKQLMVITPAVLCSILVVCCATVSQALTIEIISRETHSSINLSQQVSQKSIESQSTYNQGLSREDYDTIIELTRACETDVDSRDDIGSQEIINIEQISPCKQLKQAAQILQHICIRGNTEACEAALHTNTLLLLIDNAFNQRMAAEDLLKE